MKIQRQLLSSLGALVILMAIAPTRTIAHGGPPAALGLLAANPDVDVVLLNEGLALKRPEGWSYLCPSLWGESMLASGKFPLARSADGHETFVPGAEDLFVLRDGELVAQGRPEYRRNAMIALANDSQYVYGLHITTLGARSMSEVVRLNAEGEPRFYPSQEYWGAITANDEGVYIAATATEQLTLVTLDKTGQEIARATAMLPLTLYDVALHVVGARVYVTGTGETGTLVGYFEGGAWTEVVQDPLLIAGPQTSADGTTWIAIGGALARLHDGMIEPVGDSRFVTCIEHWNDRQYACVGNDLHELTAEGIGERVFQMQGILGTDPAMITADNEDYCGQQWTLFKIDAMRNGLMFVDWPSEQAAAAGASGSAPAMPTVDAGNMAAPMAGAGPAGVAGQASAPPTSSGGCTVAGPHSSADRALALWLSGIGATVYARRARKRRRRS